MREMCEGFFMMNHRLQVIHWLSCWWGYLTYVFSIWIKYHCFSYVMHQFVVFIIFATPLPEGCGHLPWIAYLEIVYYHSSHTNRLFKFDDHSSLGTWVALGFVLRKKTELLIISCQIVILNKFPQKFLISHQNRFAMEEIFCWISAMVILFYYGRMKAGPLYQFLMLRSSFWEFMKTIYDSNLR